MSAYRVFALVCVLVVTGCAGTSGQGVPLPDQSVTVTRADLTRIYFVREDWVGGRRRAIRVLDNDKLIGHLTPGTFLCWERAPGKTVGRAFYESRDPLQGQIEGIVALDCVPGRAYYYNVEVSREGSKPTITELDVEAGRRLVAERDPAGLD